MLTFTETTKEELIDWIFPGDFEVKQRTLRAKRLAGSGCWFLNRPEFKDWVSGASSNTLHCPGLGRHHEHCFTDH